MPTNPRNVMTHSLAIFGCGDFLRWQADALARSKSVRVAALYDPDKARAEQWARRFDGAVVAGPDEILADRSINLVALFVPPWVRRDLFLRVIAAGKHVITTKPFAPTAAACEEMRQAAARAGMKAGIIYGRTEDRFVEAAKRLFESGKLGRLALYRQDWIHAFPQWNSWATDPEKNGGPFMDAMIHNLNTACYLMDRPVAQRAFFSDRLAHPDLKCADTEAMVVHFKDGGVANLFITWAADLATYRTDGNDREHIDWMFLVTDRGWRITKESREGGPVLIASREGRRETFECPPIATPYDAFAAHLDGGPFPGILATLADGGRDIALIRGEGGGSP